MTITPEQADRLITDAELMSAAPDLAETIAGMRYEYAVEMMDDGEWKDIWDLWSTEKEARKEYASLAHSESVGDYRLVRRLVGPAEPIAKETNND